MKKITRIVAVLLVAVMALAGCGKAAEETKAPETKKESKAAESKGQEESKPAETKADAGTAAAGDSADQKITIGVSLPHMSSPARVAMANEIEEAVKTIGKGNWEVIITEAGNDTAKQTSDVEDLIQQGVDAIIMCPISTDPLVPVCQEVQAAGIPLILIDRTISSEDYDYYGGGDNYLIGVQAADYIGEKLNGEGKVVIIQGTLGGSATNDRQAGFVDTLAEKYPNIEVLDEQSGEWARDVGMKVMEDYIQAYGDDIDAVYSHGDNSTLGALQAIADADKDYIVVTADGQKEVFDAIKAGTVDACMIFLGGGKESIDLLHNLLNGEPPAEKVTYLEVPCVVSDNVDEYYDMGY